MKLITSGLPVTWLPCCTGKVDKNNLPPKELITLTLTEVTGKVPYHGVQHFNAMHWINGTKGEVFLAFTELYLLCSKDRYGFIQGFDYGEEEVLEAFERVTVMQWLGEMCGNLEESCCSLMTYSFFQFIPVNYWMFASRNQISWLLQPKQTLFCSTNMPKQKKKREKKTWLQLYHSLRRRVKWGGQCHAPNITSASVAPVQRYIAL